jgi:hypothetical protein
LKYFYNIFHQNAGANKEFTRFIQEICIAKHFEGDKMIWVGKGKADYRFALVRKLIVD